MPLNPNLLRLAVAQQAERVLIREVRPLVKIDFEEKKKQFLEEFDKDPVSQEISAGPDAFSQVKELADTGGNLFSFLGFLSTKNPIASLREYLDSNIVLYQTRAGKRRGNQIIFETSFTTPTQSDINKFVALDSDTKLKWTTRPFTSLLEYGIPGLPNFLAGSFRSPKPSQSGGGLQSAEVVRKGDSEKTPKIPYISRLLGVLNRIMRPPR